MVKFEEALNIVLEAARPLSSEPVGINKSLGRVLLKDIVADHDMPPFNKSAMDGYACRKEDLESQLEVIEIIAAGKTPEKEVGKNQCSKIMTGAVVPNGADCVIMVEHTQINDLGKVEFIKETTNTNICFKGEDIKAGQVVLEKNTRIGPQHIAVLATVGCVNPEVSRKPKIGIIATGDELVEPAKSPGASSIRNSNSYQLFSQVLAANSQPTYYGIAKDTDEDIDEKLKLAISENDVVLLSGGVSMGDYDLVPGIIKKNGIDVKFDSIAMKPGKPTHFGLSDEVYCFGLPGNPVSTYIQFEILVKPFLYKLMGHDYQPVTSMSILGKKIMVKRNDRESWIPVYFDENQQVVPIDYHGSAHINALGFADGFIVIPAGVKELSQGTVVSVRYI